MALILTMLVLPKQLMASDIELFSVYNVSVDQTAGNAVIAQKQAMMMGTRDAFNRLAERILDEIEYDTFVLPNDDILNSFVRDFEIKNEQLSNTRYLAQLTFRFYPDAVRNFFSGNNVDFVTEKSDPVLILPFFKVGEDITLWQGANPWKETWAKVSSKEGVVPVRVPLGDITDVGLINADVILNGDIEPIKKLMKRYGTKDVLLIVASDVAKADTKHHNIKLTFHEIVGSDLYKMKDKEIIIKHDGALSKRDWKNASNVVVDYLYKRWKRQSSAHLDMAKKVNLDMSFSTMREWVDFQRKLKKIGAFKGYEVLSLKKGKARIGVRLKGSQEKLKRDLKDVGLVMSLSIPENRGWSTYDKMASNNLYILEHADETMEDWE